MSDVRGGRDRASRDAGTFAVVVRLGRCAAVAGRGRVEALRKEGSRVEVITPDADSRAAMGTNQMDRP